MARWLQQGGMGSALGEIGIGRGNPWDFMQSVVGEREKILGRIYCKAKII
jgi:hypothetical protein